MTESTSPTPPEGSLPAPAPAAAAPPASRPMTVAEAWVLSIAVGLAALLVLACVAAAFDVPALTHALDVRRLFR